MISSFVAALLSLCLSAAPVQSRTWELAQARTKLVLINFEGKPLIKVVKWMSKKTGKNFIVNDACRKHPITIVSSTPVTTEEAYQAFLLALEAEGLQVVQSGKFYKITRGTGDAKRQSRDLESSDCVPVTGISQVDDHTWIIQRSEFQKRLGAINCLVRQARIVPNFEDGQPKGFKLFAIRPGSLFSKMGIKNGDVIRKINGHEINSPDRALEVYAKLKEAQTVEIELLRKGQTKVLTYLIKQ